MTSGKCAHRMAYHIYLTRSGFIAQRPWRMRGRRSKWKWFWRGDIAPTCEIKRWDGGSGLVAFHSYASTFFNLTPPPPLPPHPSTLQSREQSMCAKRVRTCQFIHPGRPLFFILYPPPRTSLHIPLLIKLETFSNWITFYSISGLTYSEWRRAPLQFPVGVSTPDGADFEKLTPVQKWIRMVNGNEIQLDSGTVLGIYDGMVFCAKFYAYIGNAISSVINVN